MDRSGFLKLLGRKLYPVLRSEGFKGSGATLRRIDGELIHVFNFQGSTSGTRCYLNLGTHLSFLPSESGRFIAAESLTEPDCVFRDRIDHPSAPAAAWNYGDSTEEAERCIDEIVEAWGTQGHAFFARYASYPDSFLSLVQSTPVAGVNARRALHLARIATHLGLQEQAVAFAREGLATARERASVLREELLAVLADNGVSTQATGIP